MHLNGRPLVERMWYPHLGIEPCVTAYKKLIPNCAMLFVQKWLLPQIHNFVNFMVSQCLYHQFFLIISELIQCYLWTWARVQTARSIAYFNGCPYIFDILLYYYICLCTTFLWPLRFCWLLVLSLYKEDYLQIFKCVSFWLHGCCG